MKERPTIATVAKLAGVSPSTVSFVLNKREDIAISEQTKTKVLAAVEELGYRPSPAARMLAMRRTHSVLLLLQTVHNPFYEHIIEHVHNAAQSSGYQVVIAQSNSLTDWTVGGATSTPSFMVDGIIACAELAGVESFLKVYPKPFPPIVGLISTYKDMDYVDVDRYAGSTDAVHHLLSSGRRRIAYMVNASSRFPEPGGLSDSRGDAYRDVMSSAGLEAEHIIATAQTKYAAREAIREYVKLNGCPEGIFCTTDEMAIGTHKGLCELEVRIPQDVALVGYGGISETEFLTPALSTISQFMEEACRIGWQFLENRMNNPSLECQQTILKPRLIIRESSGG